jgi:hypothetical protein
MSGITHGHTRGRRTPPEYQAWLSMRQRCNNPNRADYKHYGGRGISICERWDSFENFLADLGIKPSPKHSIHRIDNDKGYSPDNCVWALPLVQANERRTNRRVAIGGVTRTVAEWARGLAFLLPPCMTAYSMDGRLKFCSFLLG